MKHMSNEYLRLLKNLIAFGLVVTGIVLLVIYFSTSSEADLKIADTPIHILRIREIAEISSISYRDEVVVDSIEWYEGTGDLTNIMEWPEIVDRSYSHMVKRRLTLIYKGELKYGFDLKKDEFKLTESGDSVYLTLPKAEILSITINPRDTELFQEQGAWNDHARRKMEKKAIDKLRGNAEVLNLAEKAEENITRLIQKLIPANRHASIQFK